MCSFDENTVIIADRKANSQAGEVYVYTLHGNSWEISQTLQPKHEHSEEHFGGHVACFDDEIIVQASRAQRAQRFKRSSIGWEAFGAEIYSGPGSMENLAGRLKMSATLNLVNADRKVVQVPAVALFEKENGTWVPDRHVINPFPPEFEEGSFGFAVAESPNLLAISAPMSDFGADNVGSVYVESTFASTTAVDWFESVERTSKELELFPSPVQDFLNVRHPRIHGSITSVLVIDVLGRSQDIVFETVNSSTIKVKTQKLSSGWYGITICGSEKDCFSSSFTKKN